MKREIAIGDIHGRFDLLVDLWSKINFNPVNDIIIFLGDYIDRGLQSKEVVQFVIGLAKKHPNNIFLLKGNHEEMGINTIDPEVILKEGDNISDTWKRNGGLNTIKSYGDLEKTKIGLMELKPYLKLYHMNEKEKVIYVHAALPGVYKIKCKKDMEKLIKDESGGIILPLRDHLLWSREYTWQGQFEVIVGHDIVSEVKQSGNFIQIDTGAFDSGILTAYDTINDKIYDVKGEIIQWEPIPDMRGYA